MNTTFIANKILAAIGSLLLFLSFFPLLNIFYFSGAPFAGIVGLTLVLIGVKGLAEHYKNGNLYQNALTGGIFGIIGYHSFTHRRGKHTHL